MCLVSNKIKFCTCKAGSFFNLQHYWRLYRFQKGKDDFILGEAVLPTSMTDKNFALNETTLLTRLNERDAFDTPLTFCPGDILEVVINNNEIGDAIRFTYSFKFKKGKWIAIEADPFQIINHFKEEKFGKIKSALKRKTK